MAPTHALAPDALAAAADAAGLDAADIDRLAARAAAYLGGRSRNLERRYERALTADDGVVLLADTDFWDRVGDALRFEDDETAALRRAHEATLTLAGARAGRDAEFESALEIRTAVVLPHRTR